MLGPATRLSPPDQERLLRAVQTLRRLDPDLVEWTFARPCDWGLRISAELTLTQPGDPLGELAEQLLAISQALPFLALAARKPTAKPSSAAPQTHQQPFRFD